MKHLANFTKFINFLYTVSKFKSNILIDKLKCYWKQIDSNEKITLMCSLIKCLDNLSIYSNSFSWGPMMYSGYTNKFKQNFLTEKELEHWLMLVDNISVSNMIHELFGDILLPELIQTQYIKSINIHKFNNIILCFKNFSPNSEIPKEILQNTSDFIKAFNFNKIDKILNMYSINSKYINKLIYKVTYPSATSKFTTPSVVVRPEPEPEPNLNLSLGMGMGMGMGVESQPEPNLNQSLGVGVELQPELELEPEPNLNQSLDVELQPNLDPDPNPNIKTKQGTKRKTNPHDNIIPEMKKKKSMEASYILQNIQLDISNKNIIGILHEIESIGYEHGNDTIIDKLFMLILKLNETINKHRFLRDYKTTPLFSQLQQFCL